MMRLSSIMTLALASIAAPFAARAEDSSLEVIGHAKPWQLGFQPAASPVMESLVWLHNDVIMYIITAITIFVLVLMIYIGVRFRAKANPVASKTTHNVKLEVVWTVVPVMILVVIAIPSVKVHSKMERNIEADMTLKVTGYQWYWGYEYPDHGGVTFDSRMIEDAALQPHHVRLLSVDEPVVVPVNAKVRVQITAADVIHAWAVPSFGVKRDAVPGRLNETWFQATKEGIYYGQCSELCGVKHGFMPIEVRVVSQAKFDDWIAEKQQQAGIVMIAPTSAVENASGDESAPESTSTESLSESL